MFECINNTSFDSMSKHNFKHHQQGLHSDRQTDRILGVFEKIAGMDGWMDK